MDNLKAFALQKFRYRDKVAISRNKHRDVVGFRPSQADHIGDHTSIDALFLGASHVGLAIRASRNFMLAAWAFWEPLLLLPLQNYNMRAWHFI